MKATGLIICFIIFRLAFSLPGDVLVLDSLQLESFNKSLDLRPLYSTASNYVLKRAKTPLTYVEAIEKGDKLLCQLENPNLGEDDSKDLTSRSLVASGWARNIVEEKINISPSLKQALIDYGVMDTDIGKSNNISWRHTMTRRNSKGEVIKRTNAEFKNMYNAGAGFIIAVRNVGIDASRQYRPNPKYPDVSKWSDVVFFEWKTQAQERQSDIKELKFVLRDNIVNEDTQRMITTAVPDETALTWPGREFSMTEPEAKAILGSPNGYGVAYLLSDHKAAFGQKTIRDVRVWTALAPPAVEGSGPSKQFYAAFRIVPVTTD